MAPSTEPPSESIANVAPARSWFCAKERKCRGVSAVIAPAAETKPLHLAPHASAGPCMRNSKRIGNARSVAACTLAGNGKSSGAKASAIANERNRLILPLSRHSTHVFLRGFPRLAGLERPHGTFPALKLHWNLNLLCLKTEPS